MRLKTPAVSYRRGHGEVMVSGRAFGAPAEGADSGVTVGIDSRYCDGVLFGLTGGNPDGAAALTARLREGGVRVGDDLALPGSPDPELLTQAAQRLGVRPGRAAVLTDSEAEVIAARAGGFGLVIGVIDVGGGGAAGVAGVALRECGADAVVADLAEVQVRSTGRRMSTLPDALTSFDQLAGPLAGRPAAIFFDFDGTLSPIVEHPEAAALAPGAAEALRSLAARYPVAVLSGRDLADVRERVGISGLWYAGSHGFEMVAPDGEYHRNEVAAQAIPLLERAATELTDRLVPWSGVVVEHKRFAVAVHYRNAVPEAAAAVTTAVHDVGGRLGLKVTAGRKVVELRPNLNWDKGKTLEWIAGRLAGGVPLAPIFLGDDLTDEDGFDAVLHDGVGIVVRHTEDGDRATAARFCLDDPEHVVRFARRLVEQVIR